MTSGRDEMLGRGHIDFDKAKEERYAWVNNTGGAAHDGLTVRDYFAAKAMADLMGYMSYEDVVAKAYAIADLMMKERNK